jgi:hypothetical protein
VTGRAGRDRATPGAPARLALAVGWPVAVAECGCEAGRVARRWGRRRIARRWWRAVVVERGGGASGATAGCHRVVGRQWRVVVAPIVDYRKEVRGADRQREVVRRCGEIAVAPPRLWVADGRWQVSQGGRQHAAEVVRFQFQGGGQRRTRRENGSCDPITCDGSHVRGTQSENVTCGRSDDGTASHLMWWVGRGRWWPAEEED